MKMMTPKANKQSQYKIDKKGLIFEIQDENFGGSKN